MAAVCAFNADSERGGSAPCNASAYGAFVGRDICRQAGRQAGVHACNHNYIYIIILHRYILESRFLRSLYTHAEPLRKNVVCVSQRVAAAARDPDTCTDPCTRHLHPTRARELRI
jgi:hypothetical protein